MKESQKALYEEKRTGEKLNLIKDEQELPAAAREEPGQDRYYEGRRIYSMDVNREDVRYAFQ